MEDPVKEAKKILDETIELAKKIYGKAWMKELNSIEDRFGGDPYDVLDYLKRVAESKGIKLGEAENK